MNKVALPSEKIKDFLSVSKNIEIPKGDLRPILNYIKINIEFGVCEITKTNHKSFVVFSFKTNEDDFSCLIEEKKLINFINSCGKDSVEISYNEKYVFIKDGKLSQKYNAGVYSVDEFPEVNSSGRDFTRLDKGIIDTISVAKVYSAKDEILKQMSAVYIKDGYVFSSNMRVMYIKKINAKLPDIYMDITECNVVSKLNYAEYCVLDNYNIYKSGDIVYGFVKQEDLNPFDYSRFLSAVKHIDRFSAKVSDLIDFCNSAIAMANSTFCTASASCKNGGLSLIYEDIEKDEHNEMDLESVVIGNPLKFMFNPFMLNPILKAVPYGVVSFSDDGALISMKTPEDDNFVTILSKIAP